MRRIIGLFILSLLGTVAAAHDHDDRDRDHDRDRDEPRKVVSAPEIDPAGAFAALTLLAGSLAVLRGRRGGK